MAMETYSDRLARDRRSCLNSKRGYTNRYPGTTWAKWVKNEPKGRYPNKFPGKCAECGTHKSAGEGEIDKNLDGKWITHCKEGDCAPCEYVKEEYDQINEFHKPVR